MDGAGGVVFLRLVRAATRVDGAGPLATFLRASDSGTLRSPSRTLFRSPSGTEDDAGSVSSRLPVTPSPLKGKLHSLELYLSNHLDVSVPALTGQPMPCTAAGRLGDQSSVARTLAFGDEDAATKAVNDAARNEDNPGSQRLQTIGNRIEADLALALLLLCGAPIALVAPHIVDACGEDMAIGQGGASSDWVLAGKPPSADVLPPLPALRAAVKLLNRCLRPCLPMLPPSLTLALRDRTLLRIVSPPLHQAVEEQVQRSAGDRAVSSSSSRGGGVAAALSLGSAGLLLGLAAGQSTGAAGGRSSELQGLGGLGLGLTLALTDVAKPVASGPSTADVSLDVDAASLASPSAEALQQRVAAYQRADAAELAELRSLVGGSAGSTAWSSSSAGRGFAGAINGGSSSGSGSGAGAFAGAATGRPLHGPGDISIPYSHDADSKLHLPKGDRAAQADFSRRESLRDAFLDLVRAYRDVGASFTALTREQVWAQLPARAAAMAELLVPANVQWFARLFLHELCLFAQHDALLGSGAHGGDAAFGVAMALSSSAGAGGSSNSSVSSGGSGGKGVGAGGGSGGKGHGSGRPAAAAAHSHSQLAKMQRLSGRLGPSAEQEAAGSGFGKSRGGTSSSAGGGTWSGAARGAGVPAGRPTAAASASGPWSQGTASTRRPPPQAADGAAGGDAVAKPRAQHSAAAHAGAGAAFPQLPSAGAGPSAGAAPQPSALPSAGPAPLSFAAMASRPSPAAVAVSGATVLSAAAAVPSPAATGPAACTWGSRPSFANSAAANPSRTAAPPMPPSASARSSAAAAGGRPGPVAGKASALEARMASTGTALTAAAAPAPASRLALASGLPVAAVPSAPKPADAQNAVVSASSVPAAASAAAVPAATASAAARAKKRVPLAPAATDSISLALPAESTIPGAGAPSTAAPASSAVAASSTGLGAADGSSVRTRPPSETPSVADASAMLQRTPAPQKRLLSERFFGALLREIDSAALSIAVMHAACASVRALVLGRESAASTAAAAGGGGGRESTLSSAVQVAVLSRLIADISCSSLAEGLDSNFPADRRDALAGCLAYRPPLPPAELITEALNRSGVAQKLAPEQGDGAALLLACLAGSEMLHATAAVLLQNIDDTQGLPSSAPQIPDGWSWWRSAAEQLLRLHAELARASSTSPAASVTRLQVLLAARLDAVLSCCSGTSAKLLATHAESVAAGSSPAEPLLATADGCIGSRLLLMHVESLSQASECLDVLPDLLRALLQREDAVLPFAAAGGASSRSRSVAASVDGDLGIDDADGLLAPGVLAGGRSSAGSDARRLRADSAHQVEAGRGLAASLRLPSDDEAMPSTSAAAGNGSSDAASGASTGTGPGFGRAAVDDTGAASPSAVTSRPPASPVRLTRSMSEQLPAAFPPAPGREQSAPTSAGGASLQRAASASGVGTPLNSPRPSAARGGGATSASGPGSVGGSIRKIRPVLVSLTSSADAPPAPPLPLPLPLTGASSLWPRSGPLAAVDETAALEAGTAVPAADDTDAAASAVSPPPSSSELVAAAAAVSPAASTASSRPPSSAKAPADPLLSMRFQHTLTTSWLRQNPGMQPLIEANVQAALAAASLPLAWAADSSGAGAPAASASDGTSPAAAAGDGPAPPLDPLKQAQQRARAALSALLGTSGIAEAGVSAGAAGPRPAAREIERRAAIAEVAGNVAAQLIAARMSAAGGSAASRR